MEVCIVIRVSCVRSWRGYIGDVIINDHVDRGNVDTTGENIRGDQDLCFKVAEFIDYNITLATLEFTGQTSNDVALSA